MKKVMITAMLGMMTMGAMAQTVDNVQQPQISQRG